MRAALVLMVALSMAGCGGLASAALAALEVASAAGQGSQWLGSAIDAAEGGAGLFFDRHPNMEHEGKIRRAVQAARLAKQSLDASLAAADAAQAGDVEGARSEALIAWAALRQLIDVLGILSASPPDGGPETSAPPPQPFELPTEAEIAASMR